MRNMQVVCVSYAHARRPLRTPQRLLVLHDGGPGTTTGFVADAAIAVAAALVSVVSSLEHGGTRDVVGPAAVSGAFAGSTAYGLVQVHRCRAAHELRPQWSLDDMPAVM